MLNARSCMLVCVLVTTGAIGLVGAGDSDSVAVSGLRAAETREPAMQVLERVDHFYTSAWERLTLYVTISLAIVGVVVPVVLQGIQRAQLKRDEESLRRSIRQEVERAKTELQASVDRRLTELETELQDLVSDARKRLEARQQHVAAGVFIVQGNVGYREKRFDSAIISWARSVLCATESDDEALLVTCVNNLDRGMRNEKVRVGLDNERARQVVGEAVVALESSNSSGTHMGAIAAIKRTLQEYVPKGGGPGAAAADEVAS